MTTATKMATARRAHPTSHPITIGRAVDAFLARPDEPVLFDVETTGLDPRTNKLVMVQLCQPSSQAVLIVDWRLFYDEGFAPQRRAAVDHLRRLFGTTQKPGMLAVGHNIKFDSQFLLMQGVRIPRVFDTMLAEQLIYAGRSGGLDFSLAGTLKRRFNRDLDKLKREWFYEPAPLDERREEWDAPFPQEEVEYAALDVEVLPQLYETQARDLDRFGLAEVADIEMRALPAIALMEWRGIRINVEGWRAFIAEQQEAARRYEDEALAVLGPHIMAQRIAEYDAATVEWEAARAALKDYEAQLKEEFEYVSQDGVEALGGSWGAFKKAEVAKYREAHPIPAKPKLDLGLPNIGSQKQLTAAMEALDIPVPTKRNDKGEVKPTTESDALERLAVRHPILRTVLDYREAAKFVESFGEKLLGFADEKGRIHPDYHQIGTDTGRMSCSNPNWQQVPSKGDGKRLRANVIAGEGNVLITADFSNIELRIIAELSGDQTMLEMFASGQDLHSYTARVMFGLGDEVDPKHTEWRGGLTYRQAAKIVNYLIPYGGSAFAIAAQNNMPVEDADELVEKWFGMFGGVRRWMEGLEKQLTRHGERPLSRTASGRIRRYVAPTEPSRYGYPDTKEGFHAFMEAQRQYRKEWAAIKRQGRNAPVQGLSADITKLAVATFYENCDPRLGIIVAVVHDEMVVEGPEFHSGIVAEVLADAMDRACRRYLHRVHLPRPNPTIAYHWTHD